MNTMEDLLGAMWLVSPLGLAMIACVAIGYAVTAREALGRERGLREGASSLTMTRRLSSAMRRSRQRGSGIDPGAFWTVTSLQRDEGVRALPAHPIGRTQSALR
ncbi:hypothetical protein BE15_02000 [Sorangium cellulosum]|uniref:Uncharacterized protein n=1 Tax=Sorangium cellulosum TaxID=56 RepID=A0A150QAF4_SORCE|nr:hypothetical protein BE15_02000 [Sorangium cellulosum]